MPDGDSALPRGLHEFSGPTTAEHVNGSTPIQITPPETLVQPDTDRVIPAPLEEPALETARADVTPAIATPTVATPAVVAQAGAVPQMVLQKISEARKIKRGEPDPMGETVTRIYVATDHFIIYTAESAAGDVGRLRYILPDDYASAKSLRALLAPIAGPLAFVSDVIASMRGWTARLPWMSQYCMLRERTLDLCARAIQMAFEGQADAAKALVGRCLVEVTVRRDSANRMRYIFANTMALIVILAVVYFDKSNLHLMKPSDALTAPTAGIRTIDVLALGALGAFFSVSADINAVRVNHSISIWEMLYAGFVRVPIGVIAAAVVILLVLSGWILGTLPEPSKTFSIYLFGFMAGFSEYFVPNALKQLAGNVPITVPGAEGTTVVGQR